MHDAPQCFSFNMCFPPSQRLRHAAADLFGSLRISLVRQTGNGADSEHSSDKLEITAEPREDMRDTMLSQHMVVIPRSSVRYGHCWGVVAWHIRSADEIATFECAASDISRGEDFGEEKPADAAVA